MVMSLEPLESLPAKLRSLLRLITLSARAPSTKIEHLVAGLLFDCGCDPGGVDGHFAPNPLDAGSSPAF